MSQVRSLRGYPGVRLILANGADEICVGKKKRRETEREIAREKERMGWRRNKRLSSKWLENVSYLLFFRGCYNRVRLKRRRRGNIWRTLFTAGNSPRLLTFYGSVPNVGIYSPATVSSASQHRRGKFSGGNDIARANVELILFRMSPRDDGEGEFLRRRIRGITCARARDFCRRVAYDCALHIPALRARCARSHEIFK